ARRLTRNRSAGMPASSKTPSPDGQTDIARRRDRSAASRFFDWRGDAAFPIWTNEDERGSAMTITRRHVLTRSAGAAAAFVAGGLAGVAYASAEEAQALLDEFTGGITPDVGRIALTAPELAENGNAVAVSVAVESAMEGSDMVETVL